MKGAENCSYAHDSNSCVRVSACEGYLSAPNESAVHSRVTFASCVELLRCANESAVHRRVTFASELVVRWSFRCAERVGYAQKSNLCG